MRDTCEVAIVGAGPYGLSMAAHLDALGVSFRIFGKALDTWRDHMPKGMLLKSDGFASNISAPSPDSTLKAYCALHGIEYADQGLPVRLDLFNAYATWFQKRFVPSLETTHVTSLTREGTGISLTLETGECVHAREVVLAPGVTWFANVPELLRNLPGWAASHSSAHHDVGGFKGRQVAVIGAGSSAIDLAASLDEAGAKVHVVARAKEIRYHTAPDGSEGSLLRKIQSPSTGIGPGWRSFFCAETPLLFHRMPEAFRLRATRRHLGPAPGWFMRGRIDGKIPTLLGHELVGIDAANGRVALALKDTTGTIKAQCFDHVIAATGYKPDLSRLPFLSARLTREIAAVENTPILSDQFETSVRGLYVVGPAAANSFGPLMRFMVGAEFAAPRLGGHLARRAAELRQRHAA